MSLLIFSSIRPMWDHHLEAFYIRVGWISLSRELVFLSFRCVTISIYVATQWPMDHFSPIHKVEKYIDSRVSLKSETNYVVAFLIAKQSARQCVCSLLFVCDRTREKIQRPKCHKMTLKPFRRIQDMTKHF